MQSIDAISSKASQQKSLDSWAEKSTQVANRSDGSSSILRRLAPMRKVDGFRVDRQPATLPYRVSYREVRRLTGPAALSSALMETTAELPDDLPYVLGVLFDDPPCLLHPPRLGLRGVLTRGRL